MKTSTTAAPQNVVLTNEEARLADPARNRDDYLTFNREVQQYAHAKIMDVGPAVLYEIKNGQRYVVLNHDTERVDYYMRWAERRILGKPVTFQSLVWSDRNVGYLRGFAGDIFFSRILDRTGAGASDRKQTLDGRQFWFGLIRRALRDHLYVFYTDQLKQTVLRITDFNEVMPLEPIIWRDGNDGQAQAIVIAKTELWRGIVVL